MPVLLAGLLLDSPLRAQAPVEFAPCQLQDVTGVSVVAAECGSLRVLENPQQADGRRIALRVARLGAVSRRKQADPLFVLAGGPGMAATTFYASAAVAFERIRRERDIVLLDQRGTGGSNPLNCALQEDDLYQASEQQIQEEARRCLATLRPHAEVQYYDTSMAVRDLEQLRAALGYGRINLYGVSYGTRVAQHYVRHYAEHVRTAVLDGVVPPELALGPASALNAEQALTHILARCAADAPCHQHFGDPSAAYRHVRSALQEHPVAVSLPDPTTAQPAHLQFSSLQLASVLRLASYTAEQAAVLPLMLDRAAAAADYAPLAAQFLLINRTYDNAVSYGMHNSVVCSEDVPFYRDEQIDRAALARTYLGTAQLDGLRSICAVWPHGPIDADFHEPLRSAVPVLLLSGSDDPVTPPQDAERARRGLTQSAHVVLRGFGHGQLSAPCVDRLMAQFIARGAVQGLDVGCVSQDKPLPFFISMGGPAP
ncbi:MAG: alpha/beta fold hydrolase [Sinobacteraceae bacterium]|nr:alpha/beta fold hydrolase [Nevskiaceae bacterium]